MLFALKKVVSYGLMPLPLCLAALAAGWLLTAPGRSNKCGRRLVGAALLLLLLFGNSTVSTALVRPLEKQFPPVPELRAGDPLPPELAGCRYVVVLGSGHGDVAGLAAADKLCTSGLERIVEGVRLMRALPAARLIVSGPSESPGYPTHASVLAAAAESLGIAPDRIMRVEAVRDTEDESHAVKQLVGSERVALVTSAWHMPRAAGLFRKSGVDVAPCPTDYSARPSPYSSWTDLSWDVESLARSTNAVHEWIGCLWERMRGKM